MPTATRSQTTLEDKGVSSSKPAPSNSKTSKRKPTESTASAPKKQKKQPSKASIANVNEDNDTEDNSGDRNSIKINRAPVLELWGSCVAQFLYPSLPWLTCLGVGGAISTITAISKGRSIGTMHKPDPGEQQKKREKRKSEQSELEEVEVMSFNIKLKDGNAMVGDKPKKGNEDALKKKFGDDAYEKTKKTFEEVLKKWKGKEQDLNERAFGMYEDFRPNIPAGQNGWGRKGKLRLDTIKSAGSAG